MTPRTTTRRWRARRGTSRRHAPVLVAGGVGLALAVVAAAVAWGWRDELPDPVASHWSGARADGFMSLEADLAVMVGTSAAFVALFVAIGVRAGQSAAARKVAAAGAVGLSALMAVLVPGSLAAQRGLADAADAPNPGTATALSFAAMVALGAAAWFAVPGDPPSRADGPVPADAPRVPLGDGERAVWLRRAAGGVGIAIGAVAVLVAVSSALASGTWGTLVVPLVLALVLAAMFAFTVRVDATGLTVRSALGWPRSHVPADEIERASVVQVRPFGDFGGWGWRIGRDGRVGVVLRAGEGLLVERSGGRSLVVTVDDAATAAALLNTMAERAR
ncbi:DUF1648 domain-containing protein [Puerhibacterium puerhi]|uniref:DUF1648 domain-containing protein n=1 Tax=Puerhibacterium puerhi TaxID=2692623 RepID=UPI00191558A2|nr:DUF1648 domain-containing protein [Puerhibacterium puerhi]